jgi:hypothetical protein
MAIPHRTKQVNLRFPLPLLSQIKSEADAKQQAIADWIVAAISRELEPERSTQKSPESIPASDPFVLHPEFLAYIENCLAPLHTQISELRMQMGESKA